MLARTSHNRERLRLLKQSVMMTDTIQRPLWCEEIDQMTTKNTSRKLKPQMFLPNMEPGQTIEGVLGQCAIFDKKKDADVTRYTLELEREIYVLPGHVMLSRLLEQVEVGARVSIECAGAVGPKGQNGKPMVVYYGEVLS